MNRQAKDQKPSTETSQQRIRKQLQASLSNPPTQLGLTMSVFNFLCDRVSLPCTEGSRNVLNSGRSVHNPRARTPTRKAPWMMGHTPTSQAFLGPTGRSSGAWKPSLFLRAAIPHFSCITRKGDCRDVAGFGCTRRHEDCRNQILSLFSRATTRRGATNFTGHDRKHCHKFRGAYERDVHETQCCTSARNKQVITKRGRDVKPIATTIPISKMCISTARLETNKPLHTEEIVPQKDKHARKDVTFDVEQSQLVQNSVRWTGCCLLLHQQRKDSLLEGHMAIPVSADAQVHTRVPALDTHDSSTTPRIPTHIRHVNNTVQHVCLPKKALQSTNVDSFQQFPNSRS